MSALDLGARLRAWTYHQQRLADPTSGPLEALRAIIGVYSSHPTAPLSLLVRSKPFTAAHFAELEQKRQAVRVPGMRQSIFLVPTEFAARIFAATRQPIEKRRRNIESAGLTLNSYQKLKEPVLEHTQKPITSEALQKELGLDSKAALVTRFMAREGLILRLGSNLRTDNLSYVATEAWLGHPLEEHDAEDSLRWLAEQYLHAFGPARVQDFAWWSGATRRQAAAALNDAATVDVGGGLLLPTDLDSDFESLKPRGEDAVAALPKWDPYSMGYPADGRQRLVDDAYLGQAYSKTNTGAGATAGDGFPLLLRRGRAVATWSHRFDRDRMVVSVTPFADEKVPRKLYEHAFDGIGKLLGASSIEVENPSPPRTGRGKGFPALSRRETWK